MKKFYLTLLSLVSISSFAQTLDQSDLPFSGLGWTSGIDTTYSVPIPSGGAGQNWDYSNLQYDYVDTAGFGDAAGTPYAGSFPSSNLASHKVSTNEWSYFINSSTGFYINGFANDTSTFVINPPQMYIPVPFSYGNTQTNISRVVIDTIVTVPARFIINFHADFTADGTGSLITPTATYPSTLRVKEVMLETDSFLVDYLSNGNYTLVSSSQSQKTYYRWFTHGGTANYILGIDADSLGATASRSEYIMQWAVLGTEEMASGNPLIVYPDPASSQVTISTGNSAIEKLEVYDIMGKRIQVLPAEYNPLQTELKLNVSAWTSGIYFFILEENGKTLRGKFSVVH